MKSVESMYVPQRDKTRLNLAALPVTVLSGLLTLKVKVYQCPGGNQIWHTKLMHVNTTDWLVSIKTYLAVAE